MTLLVQGSGSLVKVLAVVVALAAVISLMSASFGGLGGARGEASQVQSYIDEVIPGNPRLVVTTDKASYLPGEPINITATFPYGYSATCPTSLTMYYMILDNEGTVLYDLRKHVYVLMVITFFNVGPGYSRSFIWNQADDNGKPVGSPKWLQAVVAVPAWDFPTSASSRFEINPKPASFDIALASGWNLVSMPLVNESWSAGGIGLGTGSIVVAWDAITQTYSKTFIVGISSESMDFRLMAGCSYFVWSPEDQSMTLRGCSPDFFSQFSVSLNVPSDGGWICVGFSSLGPGFYASDIPGLVKGAKVNLVCMWDSMLGVYEMYIPGMTPPNHDFAVDPGVGCWLFLDGPATLSYSP